MHYQCQVNCLFILHPILINSMYVYIEWVIMILQLVLTLLIVLLDNLNFFLNTLLTIVL